MTYAHNRIDTPLMPPTPPTGVQRAIARASARTGADFSFLLEKAVAESSLNPKATAKNSSATGLYQFVEKTWLEMIRDHGGKYGLQKYADCINGDCQVNDPKLRQTILDLRKDPETSALMAAEYAAKNAEILENRVGEISDIGETELYMAHFLGPNGATKFIEEMHRNPNAKGANLFPKEARVNLNVFYDPETGKARTMKQIYAFFDGKFKTVEADTLAAIEPGNDNSVETGPAAAALASVDQSTDQPVSLPPEFTQALLDAPATSFSAPPTPRTLPSNDTSLPYAHRKITATRAVPQAELLILAQLELHRNNDRYNS